ncbi:MAG TPA: SGNH/GDSL hydrolase family protein [Methylibium sp.]|uniref:SGNH/GDSL hydrolase family protein n=1 Tax=Methylibium sp. TaxID=2067992 RepID=UPI002DBF039A|nr:SGNH/GDSL hydrolase family protein [Methylibium sp.]HEU4458737.1 SGNH/GDSL hydrolase family protein [Methylibium sp.]
MNFPAFRSARRCAAAALTACVASFALVACGGGDDDTPAYTTTVSFGDSLSDVGTYRTATVAQLGGGKYTVNGGGPIWVERVAADRGLAAPCAAQVGLVSSGPLAAFAQTPTTQPSCNGYAQGGARVTNPVGPGNAALLALGDSSGALGQLTVPVTTQMDRWLAANGGRFNGRELVLVLAGGNDLFINLGSIGASPGQITAQQAVANMGVAGGELATLVRTKLLANGAKFVVVVNLPDVSLTPFALGLDAPSQGLINTMSTTFNTQLAAGLNGVADVLYVDAYTRGRDQAARASFYGFTNVATPACNLAALQPSTSLICTTSTLIPGDTSRYAYADGVHPTPYSHQLLADYVLARMSEVGWR